jgi:hypothetical protein
LVERAAALEPPERARKETLVLGLAILALASVAPAATASATGSTGDSAAFTSSAPWWEKVTYTISENGAPQDCVYESSMSATASCDDDGEISATRRTASVSTGSRTKVTIERRFNPGNEPGPTGLESGDTLLGGKVMSLAFDENGAVRGCRVLAASGDLTPSYGCREARAERFQASSQGSSPRASQGLLTILVYGHEEVLT